MIKKEEIVNVLKTIPDPELNISVWDLGLVYGIDIDQKKKEVTVTMTLTSIGCPLFSLIQGPVEDAVKQLPGVASVKVELTFEPPWTVERMNQEAKDMLGI